MRELQCMACITNNAELSLILSAYNHTSIRHIDINTTVAHCSRSQDIHLFKFQLSYCYNPLQDTCLITSAVLGHLMRTHVPLIFRHRDKKSYRLSEKCATLNTWSPRQNWRHFADGHFKCIFFNENKLISINISLKFVPKGPINNIPALVQIMAWHRPGNKPLSEPMMVILLTHICVTRPQWVKVR